MAEYSNRLAEAFGQRDDVEPVILAGRADEHRSIPEDWDGEVHDVAQIGLWRDDGIYQIDTDRICALGLDVLHVQYQTMLFNQEPLEGLAAAFPGTTAITFHDRCVSPDFPHWQFDLHFTHREGVGIGSPEVIPFGIENRPPVVRTFGLGRTRSDLIAPICERNGWIFETAASHEPIHGGGQAWRSHADLIAWLRGADAIVLWYPPEPMAGSSQAARTAIAARRPVITNDTEWFSDLPERSHSYVKVGSLEQLEDELRSVLSDDYALANSWDNVAAMLVDRYRQASLSLAA